MCAQALLHEYHKYAMILRIALLILLLMNMITKGMIFVLVT